MHVDEYLRLALMFGENKAHTFNKNLERMIALVLYEVESVRRSSPHVRQNGCTIVEIIELLKKKYSLNFSDTEVLKAINTNGQSRIICVVENGDLAQNEYALTPVEYDKIAQKVKQSKITEYINQFLKENEDISFSSDQMNELLNKHFYSVFNSNASTILDLIDRKYDYSNSINPDRYDFVTAEKEAINRFLYWNESGKNKLVYEMVSCCFDYCMMTTKQNSSAFKNIFYQKVFYLDSNIIFRLMGLNHENRRKVIDAFIVKCREQKVRVKVTNHTRKEVDDTIDYHVHLISDLMGRKKPLHPRAVLTMSSWIVKEGFYQAYYEWCQDSYNQSGDFESFSRDLKKRAYVVLNQFEQCRFVSYSETNKNSFSTLVESLTDYKRNKHRNAYRSIVETDINNYMYVSSQNNQAKKADFFNIHNYLISADHTFGDWAKSIDVGSIPVVVLPSVWYSIMLQYTGRSDDDYASFTSFLNFSMSNYESGAFSERKLEILKKVIALDERTEIQNEIVYGIEERLKKTELLSFDSEEIDNLISDVRQGVLDREVEAAREDERLIAEDRLKKYKEQVRHEYEEFSEKVNEKLADAREENEKLRVASEDGKQRAKEEIRKTRDDAIEEERDRIITLETEKRTNKCYRRYWIITILMILFSVGVVVGIVVWIALQPSLTDTEKEILNWIKYGFGIVAFVGNGLIIGIAFCGLNKEKIGIKIRNKVEKELRP